MVDSLLGVAGLWAGGGHQAAGECGRVDDDLSLSLEQADLTGAEVLYLRDQWFGEGTAVIRSVGDAGIDRGCVRGGVATSVEIPGTLPATATAAAVKVPRRRSCGGSGPHAKLAGWLGISSARSRSMAILRSVAPPSIRSARRCWMPVRRKRTRTRWTTKPVHVRGGRAREGASVR